MVQDRLRVLPLLNCGCFAFSRENLHTRANADRPQLRQADLTSAIQVGVSAKGLYRGPMQNGGGVELHRAVYPIYVRLPLWW